MPAKTTAGKAAGKKGRLAAPEMRWKLQDAKARFSELVRRARTEGPQLVTVRGKNAVVVMAAEELEGLRQQAKPRQPLVQFLQGLGLSAVSVEREPDIGRDVSL